MRGGKEKSEESALVALQESAANTASSTDKKQQWSGIILDNTVFQCSKQ